MSHAATESTAVRESSPVFQTGVSLLRRLHDYHGYQVVGLERATAVEGPLIVACNHSLATYDAVLLALAGYDATGRWFHAMADQLFFRIPVVREFFSTMGFVRGTRAGAMELLGRNEVLGILPGGMREALRSSLQRYTVDWRGRMGFVRLSLLSGAPIVLAACPRADDLFDVVDNPVTPFVYRRFRLALPLFRGRGPTPLPRPIKLWHLLSEPFLPNVPPDQVTDRDVEAHHAMLTERMGRLMRESLALRQSLDPEG